MYAVGRVGWCQTRHISSSNTQEHFRTTWLATAAGAVSGTAGTWISEQRLVVVEDLGAGLSAMSCTLCFLYFLPERVWVWVQVLLGYVLL